MSDMQKDWSYYNKYEEVVHDGIITYFSDEYSDDLPAELAMVLIAGDLVDTGGNYSQWSDHFFAPSTPLFARVPLYPVLGNHEANTDYYFNYFHLPENGTPGYEEHWWYNDYSNLRIIGLDSNYGYQIDAQLNWLEDVLADACVDPTIDFVFAQLHHPFKSELWIAGETDYTGDIITLMENFSTECDKPSIHFFGHTHGYSRGQSKDHSHLMVNVATAGGNIDSWGEYAQADYPEFTVSQDEWGFVLVEVDAGEDPEFLLKRISRGNEETFRDNEIRDEIRVRKFNSPPDTPVGIFPQGNGVNPDNLILEAGEFTDADGDEPQAGEWRLFQDCDLGTQPIIEEFVNQENWYFYEDTQESVELTEYPILPLEGNTVYCWQVKYRDSSLGWSEWSEPLVFQTGDSQYSANLLQNPGGESDIDNWTVTAGYMESLEAYECDGAAPHSGDYYFAVGALCNEAAYAEAYQEVDVSEFSDCIDSDLAFADFGGYLSNWGGSDHPEMTMVFLNDNNEALEQAEILDTYNSYWTELSSENNIPAGSRKIHVILMGTRYGGADNDSYFDDLYLKIWRDEACLNNGLLGDLNQDSALNILDVIAMVNIILEIDEPQPLADMNGDGNVNILDVISLVNIILGN